MKKHNSKNLFVNTMKVFFLTSVFSTVSAVEPNTNETPVIETEPSSEKISVAEESKDKTKLDKFRVTGSHIKRINTEGPAPVLQIDREAIEHSGASSLNQLLSELTLNDGYMLNENHALSTTPGSAGINLRGLGQEATLVLINGRRMSNYPYALNNSDTFVDLNSIPLAAVERVEVLKDGASAIYGSDALAGVVNIILRQDYDGAEVTASYGVSSEGDAEETRLNFVKGISSDKSNLTLVFDYFKREPFLLSDRDFSKTANQTIAHPVYGTDYRSPYDNSPANYVDDATWGGVAASFPDYFDPNPWITAVPESERVGGLLSYKRDISTDLTFFTDLLVSQNTSEYKAAPTSLWGLSIFDNVLFPAAHPNNPEGVDLALFWRITELGSRTDEIKTDTYRLVAGFEGVYNDWDWETGIHQAKSKSTLSGRNYVSASTLQTAFDNNLLNPFGTSSQADLDFIRTGIGRTAETLSQGIDAKISGEIGQMDAGPLMLAVGGSYLNEDLEDTPNLEPDILGQGSTAGKGDRNSTAVFAELNLPLQENIEMQLALRAENYSDFGSTVNPKAAIKYKPSSTVMLRASVGTAFRAPSLSELHQADTSATAFLVDTARCIDAGGVGPLCDPQQTAVIVSSNPNLDAEESTSYYLGALFEPTKQFSVGLDYWNYDQKNIVAVNTQDVVDINDDTKVIRPGGPLTAIAGVFDQYTNTANRKTDGIDIDLRYRWDTSVGKFELRSMTTKLFSFKERIRAADAYVDYAGKFQRPDLRSSLSLNWKRDDYAVVLSTHYIDSYEDSNYDNDSHIVDSYQTYDGQFIYSGFEKMSLVVGVNNILDEAPPFSNSSYAGYDSATHNPTGRFYYVRLNHQF